MNTKACIKGSFDLCKLIYTSKMLNKVKLKPTAKLVLIALANHYPNIYPSQQFIAEALGISLRSVVNSITELRSKGLLLVECNHNNIYQFSNIFFEMVNPAPSTSKSCIQVSANSAHKETTKQINNKNVFNFKKADGIKYKSPEQTRNEIERSFKKSDENIFNDKETAIKWLASLSELSLKITPIKNRADELKKQWNL